MKKKIIALLICTVMLAALLPTDVFAANEISVTKIEVTGIPVPVIGASTLLMREDIQISMTPDVPYEIVWAHWDRIKNGEVVLDDYFLAGYEYRLYLQIKLPDTTNAVFNSSLLHVNLNNSTINGAPIANSRMRNDDKEFYMFSQFYKPAASAPIPEVEILGFTEPSFGYKTSININSVSVRPSSACTVTKVYWVNDTDNKDNDYSFLGGKNYYLVAEVTPKPGYYFEWDSTWQKNYSGTAMFNGTAARSAWSTSSGGSIHMRSAFYAVSGTNPIYEVNITGVPTPAVGASTDISVSDLKLESTPANACKITDVCWYNRDNLTKAGKTFQPDTEYFIAVILTPNTNYEFEFTPDGDSITSAYINGKIVSDPKKESSTSENVIVRGPNILLPPCKHAATEIRNAKAATYTETGYSGDTYCKDCGTLISKGSTTGVLTTGQIESVTITGVKTPVVGETTAISASSVQLTSLPANACTISSLYWYNSTDGTKDDTLFKAGCQYYLYLSLRPATDCSFKCSGTVRPSYTGTVTVNGAKVSQAYRLTTMASDKNLIVHSATYTPSHTHKGTLVPMVQPTCTKKGVIAYYQCSCGKIFTDAACTDEIDDKLMLGLPMTSHNVSDWIIDKNAAPGVEGAKHTECTVCHKVIETAKIPALKEECRHPNTSYLNVKAASCTEAGYTGDLVCADCGIILEKGTATAALGHNYGGDDLCTRCGHKNPAAEPVTEPVTEPVVTEPKTEPVVTEPKTEPITEPATQPVVTDPGTEPTVTEPKTEPVTDPITDPDETAPKTEPTTDPDTNPTTGTAGTDKPDTEPDKEKKTATLWWLWPVIAVIAVGGGAAGYFITRNKKKEQK